MSADKEAKVAFGQYVLSEEQRVPGSAALGLLGLCA